MSINLHIHFKTMYTNNKLKTKININRKSVDSQWGYPLCVFLVDKQFSGIQQYMYKGIERPLSEIILDVGENLRLLKISTDGLVDLYNIFKGVRPDQLHAHQLSHEFAVLDAKFTQLQWLRSTVKVEDINLAVTSASGSFWGNLIGGIAGGALRALGLALNGWLVGCFWFNGPLRQYFSLYRTVSQREGERKESIDESKNVQTTPTRTYCKHNRPLPYYYPN